MSKNDEKIITLTIDEAKELHRNFLQLCEFAFMDEKQYRMLKKLSTRIEKAEGK